MAKFQVIIGRTENLDIPGLVLSVPAKIDTGAYRSSIHCSKIEKITKEGKEVLKVDMLGHPCSPVVYPMEFDTFDLVSITNSFGHEEERYEVSMRVKIGPKVFTSSFTLADRSNNLFPILVGRKVLKSRFMVDVTHSGVDRLKLKKTFGIKTPIDEEDLED